MQKQKRFRTSVYILMPSYWDKGTIQIPPTAMSHTHAPLLWCLPKAIFYKNSPSISALNFSFDINSPASLLALLALVSAYWHCLLRAASHLPLSSAAIDIRHDQSYPLVPPYPNILQPLIGIVLNPLVPIPSLCSLY